MRPYSTQSEDSTFDTANIKQEHKVSCCCCRAKQAFAIDFENLPELPSDAFELAPNQEISLKSMPAARSFLPPDHHYKVFLFEQ